MLPTQAAPVYLLESASLDDPAVLAWKGAKVHEVAATEDRHTIHSYFVTCPESPDGKYVLFYASTTRTGEQGEIRIVERATGKETVLASNVTTEDAHRAACQQWAAGGRKVVYHDVRDGHWLVAAVDVATGKETVLVRDRQVGFGSPYGNGVWIPVYGCHWKPGEYRDLQLVNVDTGEVRTPVHLSDVTAQCGPEIEKLLGPGDYSIFFPVLSPDGKKVFFKMSLPGGGDDFRSTKASHREGKFVWDLETARLLRFFPEWGHPSWAPDNSGIFEKGNVLFDLATGKGTRYAASSPSDHPSLSPDMTLFVTDGKIEKRSGVPGEWGIVVGSRKTNQFSTICRFDNSKGATSWRHNHPHPFFSADGKRIYFNTNSGPWTRLCVAEL